MLQKLVNELKAGSLMDLKGSLAIEVCKMFDMDTMKGLLTLIRDLMYV